MLSAILACCSTLASLWPTKAERRLVDNAVNSLDFIILSSAFKPFSQNRLFTLLTSCDGCLSPNSIALSARSINSWQLAFKCLITASFKSSYLTTSSVISWQAMSSGNNVRAWWNFVVVPVILAKWNFDSSCLNHISGLLRKKLRRLDTHSAHFLYVTFMLLCQVNIVWWCWLDHQVRYCLLYTSPSPRD